MKYFILTLVSILMFAAAPAGAQDIDGLQVMHPHAYATAKGQPNGAVFFEVSNNTESKIDIIGAKSAVAEKAELHTMSMEGDVMKMRQVEVFSLPPGEFLELKPHGDHIMLFGLNEKLEAGSDFELVLETTQRDIPVQIMVVVPGTAEDEASEPTHHHGHGHSGEKTEETE